MSFRFSFQASTPVIDSCRRDFSRVGRSCLGLCLFQGFGRHVNASVRARPRVDHQPPETVSGPYPLMGLPALRDDSESQTK